MLKISIRHEGQRSTLELEGRLAGPWVAELESAWQGERGHYSEISVELRSVSFVDADGKALLRTLHDAGAAISGHGCLTRAIIADVTGQASSHGCWGTNPTKTKLALAIVTLLGAGRAARAQQKPALRLSMHDAVVLALKQSPQTLIASLQARSVAQDQILARAALLPEAQFAATETRQRENLEALFGQPFPGLPQHIGPFEVFAAGPQFNIPIVNLANWRSFQASREDTTAAKHQERASREEIALAVISQYLLALRGFADVKAAESRVEVAQALFNQANDRQKSGAGTGIDTLRAQVELQNEKQRLLSSQTQRDVALYGLERILSLDPEQGVELADEMNFADTPRITVEESLGRAYESRPELKQLESNLHAAELRKRAAFEEHIPTLAVNGFWDYEGTRPNNGIPVYQYQAEVSVPIFTGGRIHAETVKADLELQRLKQQQQDTRDEIALEVKSAVAQLDSAKNQVDVANQGLQLALQVLTQARDRFAAGVADNIEVVQAQDALARAYDNQIEALFQYNQQRAQLARATGQMEAMYAN